MSLASPQVLYETIYVSNEIQSTKVHALCQHTGIMVKSIANRRHDLAVPIALGLIVAGGLLVRLIFFTASAPFGGGPLLLDEGNYLGIAESLYRG